jgi:hypothetical protein
MEEREEHEALHAELDRLKSALLIATDAIKRHAIHRRINSYIYESILLIKQRPQSNRATHAASQSHQLQHESAEAASN